MNFITVGGQQRNPQRRIRYDRRHLSAEYGLVDKINFARDFINTYGMLYRQLFLSGPWAAG